MIHSIANDTLEHRIHPNRVRYSTEVYWFFVRSFEWRGLRLLKKKSVLPNRELEIAHSFDTQKDNDTPLPGNTPFQKWPNKVIVDPELPDLPS